MAYGGWDISILSEQRRKNDTGNKRLPPSERAVNYAKAIVTAWPVVLGLVGLLGYTNKDHIGRFVGLAEADGETEITQPTETFEQQVKRFSEEVRIELVSLRREVQKVNSRLAQKDAENYKKLEEQLSEIDAKVTSIQELVN